MPTIFSGNLNNNDSVANWMENEGVSYAEVFGVGAERKLSRTRILLGLIAGIFA